MSKRWLLAFASLLATVAACGTGPTATPGPSAPSGPSYQVSSQLVGDATTQQVQVWAPVGHGSWPVVYAIPGVSGHKSDFDLLGPALARHGVVVIATDYRMTGTRQDVKSDMECGYRLAMRVAHRYGGDLHRPVTGVGYSFGAAWMFAAGLWRPHGDAGRAADVCGQRLPLPDVVVGVNGCYYSQKEPLGFTVNGLNRRQAQVALVTGSADRTCPAWQSKKAAATLGAAGFHATLTTIRGANHYTLVFHDVVGGKWVSAADRTAGQRTVQAILDAIKAGS